MTGKTWKTCAIGAAVAGLTALTVLNAHAAVTYDTRALKGDQAPGTAPGVVYNIFDTPVLNSAGQTAFTGFLTGPSEEVDVTNDRGLWSDGSGSMSLVARSGNAAPDTAAGVVFSGVGAIVLVLNGAGQTAFRGSLTGTGVVGSNNQGIWSEGGGSLALVARKGDAAPGTDPGVVYNGFDSNNPVLNDAGQTAFDATLTGTGVDGTNFRGIWSEGSGSLGLTARTGDAAAGTAAGVVYNQFLFTPVLNGAGQTAFVGGLAGKDVDATNNSAIWAGGTGSLSLVARSGDAAPGTDPGVVFDAPFGFNSPVINDAGQTAFTGFLTGTGVDATNDVGIWSQGSGSLSLLAREGEAAAGMAVGVVYDALIGGPVINGAGQTAFGGGITGTGVDFTNNIGLWLGGTGSLSLVARTGDQAPGTDPGVVFSPHFNYMLNGVGQIAFTSELTGPGVFGGPFGGGNNFGLWATDPAGVLTLVVRTGDLFDVNDDPLIEDLRTIFYMRIWTRSGGEDGRSRSFNDAGQLVFRLGFTDGSEGIFVASIQASLLAGDLNADGFVGIDDLNIILINWNQNVTPGDLLAGDPTGEGFVGVDDLNVVLVNWNNGTPPADGAAIPEPGTLAVLGFGVLTLLRRHGR